MTMTDEKLTPIQRELVLNNIDLARYLALLTWRRSKEEMERYEVVAVAYQGLIQAAIKFDPTRPDIIPGDVENGKAFAGYARRKIIGSILDWQRQRDHVPRRQRSIYRDLQNHGHGRGKSHKELSELTGYPIDKIQIVTQAVENTAVSLDTPPDYWDSHTQYAVVAMSTHDVESSAMNLTIMDAMTGAWENLPLLQKRVIARHYFEDQDLIAVAAALGERLPVIREAHAQAVITLREAMVREAS